MCAALCGGVVVFLDVWWNLGSAVTVASCSIAARFKYDDTLEVAQAAL
jgi:hypothetical protein